MHYWITGVRRCRQLERRFRCFLSCTPRHVFPFSSPGLSLSLGVVMIAHSLSREILTFAYLRLSFARTLKPHCNVLLHSHEPHSARMRRVSAAAFRQSGFASSSFVYSTSCLHYTICRRICGVRADGWKVYSRRVTYARNWIAT